MNVMISDKCGGLRGEMREERRQEVEAEKKKAKDV